MDSTINLISYRIEVEWVLTWFPIQANATTNAQQTRSGTFHFVNTDQPFASGNGEILLLGQGPHPPFTFGDPLTPNNVAVGFITVTVTQDEVFSLAFEVRLGTVKRTKSLLASPNTNLAFMINVIARDDHETQGTALSLHGTVTTGKRPLDFLTGAFQPGKVESSLFRP